MKIIIDETGLPGNPIIGFLPESPKIVGFPGLTEIPWTITPGLSSEFIELAREVYFNNDKRSKIKSEINKRLGSNIREVKQYVNY